MVLWFKDHIKQTLIFLFFYIGLLLFFTYPMQYELLLPGGVDSAENFIQIDKQYESSGSFNSSYVSVVTKPSPFQYLLAKNNEKAVVRELSKQESQLSISEMTASDRIYKVQSIYQSLIAAYKKADKDLEYKHEGVIIIFRFLDYKAFDKLKVGDIIIEVNHEDVNTLDDIANELFNTGCNLVNLTIIRDKKEINFDVEKTINGDSCLIGLSGYNTTENYTEFKGIPPFEIIDYSGYGPSAGLIQALSIYNGLVPTDITFSLKIAGTGTIDIEGNVGPIGGIKQKVFGASKANVDIFFAPNMDDGSGHNIYQEALKAKAMIKSDIKIVPVKTFDDALDYLLDNYDS